eukprot:TRINITY_DN20302_c0_g1_i2.p1 TRINITY_DN20302_c0_g1~~TRINITY_DN20302_c0_g1_i2.p1  ORF type:complete len:433 (-),score=80.26 TRINITY_DN20302_c0_g1_i2:566-1864(-)
MKESAVAVGEGGAKIVARQVEMGFDIGRNYKELVQRFVKKKVFAEIGRLVDKIPPILKDQLDDDEMPRWVKRGQDRVIDGVWPDFREEIMWNVAAKMDGVKAEFPDDGTGPGPIRAYFRYHLMPFDKSVWGKLRDPFWVIWLVISLVPVLGMTQMLYFVVFLFIDKSDEFQLIQFILQFKGTQFISQGLIRTIIGYFAFVHCTSLKDKPDCTAGGPWMTGPVHLVIALFLLQLVLVWAAFFMLPFSKDKARSKLKGDIEHQFSQGTTATVQGGYLYRLLIYDLIIFIICSVALLVGLSAGPSKPHGPDHWQARSLIFTTQVVYGYLSMPFFFFTLPLLQTVLTHSYPTAYDQLGRCRKPKPKKKAKKNDDSREAEVQPDLIDDSEAARLLDQVKGLLTGKSLDAVDPADSAASTRKRSAEPTAPDKLSRETE